MHIKQSLQLDEHARCTHIPDEQADGRTEGQVKTGMYVHIRVAGTLHVAHLSLPRARPAWCVQKSHSVWVWLREWAANWLLLSVCSLLCSSLCFSLLLSFLLLSAVRALAKDLWRGAQGLPRRSQKAIRLSQSLISIIFSVCAYMCVCACVYACV